MIKRYWRAIVGLILCGICAVGGFYLRFSNPDMTDTRFVLTYWPISLSLVAIGLLGYWLVGRQRWR